MIEVSLTENGDSSFLISPEQTLGEATPIFITECHRCFGGIILWERKPNTPGFIPLYMAQAWHISPGCGRYVSSMAKHLHRKISWLKKHYDALKIIRIGGKINTPQNIVHYEKMRRKIELPLQHMLPDCKIQGYVPRAEVDWTTLFMDEDFRIRVELFKQAH